MKKLFIYISLITLVVSCSKEYSSDEYGGYEMLTDYMLKEYEQGAALRQIEKTGEFQGSSPDTSVLNWIFEAHDVENGGLTQNVEVFLSYNGSFSGSASTSEILYETIDRSAMYEGEVGLPRFDMSLTMNEALAAMNLSSFSGGDIINVRFQLNLTNGESYSRSSVTGSMTGPYFRSPFLYPLIIGCLLPTGEVEAVPGTYIISATDSYEDGWSTGESVQVTVDGKVYRFGSSAPEPWSGSVANLGNAFDDGASYTWTFEMPAGAQKMTWAWHSGYYDDEVGFTITHVNTEDKSQSVVSYGIYPMGTATSPGDVGALSGMSLCY
jgi:hypothetical protein